MDYQLIKDTNVQLTKQELTNLFDIEAIKSGESLKKVEAYGGDQELARQLNTNLKNGIATLSDAFHNRKMFGDNVPHMDEASFQNEFLDSLQDSMIIILLMGLFILFILDMISLSMIDGLKNNLPVLIAIFIVVLLESLNNYFAQIQFNKWEMNLKQQECSVIRNQEIHQIPTQELLVGDILLFKQGDNITGDGLMINGYQVKIDESQMTGESYFAIKKSYTECLEHHNEVEVNPFLFSGTNCVEGSGSMLVLAVGQNSLYGRILRLVNQEENEENESPLQIQLSNIATSLGKFGLIIAFFVFVIIITHYGYECSQGTETFFSLKTLYVIIQSFMISTAITVVAIPQRLPFALSIPLAYSLNKMIENSLLIKNKQSCETMSYVNEIICNKSVLTETNMNVQKIWSQDNVLNVSRDIIDQNIIQLIGENIHYNSQLIPNNIDLALQQFIKGKQADYQNYQILTQIPFNNQTKTMQTILFNEKNKTIKIYLRGSTDKIFQQCTKYLGSNGKELPFDKNYKTIIENQVIDNFEIEGLKTIAIAYKNINYQDQNELKQYTNTLQEESQQNEFILSGIIGLKNLIKCESPQAIKYFKDLGINVRMITKDNIKIAQTIAMECGILQRNEKQGQFEIMKGEDFSKFVEGKRTQVKMGKRVQTVGNSDNYHKISQELSVISNSNSFDKQLLVLGLKNENNKTVAIINGDAEVLKIADASFGLGINGSGAAKDSVGMVLLNDSLSAVIFSIYLGRSIQNCIRKFVYFQLTAITVFLILQLGGLLILRKLPLNIVQMLWINLITDLSASLGLTIEANKLNMQINKPFRQTDEILSNQMKKSIIIEAIYQILVFGLAALILPNYILESESQQVVILFQIFVFFQIFNLLSIRFIDSKNFVSFQNLFRNTCFWLIILLILIIQFSFIEFGQLFQSGGHLNLLQNSLCIGFGFGIVLITLFIKLTIGQPWQCDSHSEQKKEKLKQ